MNVDTRDYIVIGGGHNGLSAACRLAQAGASVLLVEKLPIMGGLSTSHAYIPGAPEHLLSMGAMDDIFVSQTGLADYYGLPELGYAFIDLEAPYGWMNEDGDTLILFKDFGRTIDEIKYFSPRDAETYRSLRRSIDWILDVQQRFATTAPSNSSKTHIAKMFLRLAGDRSLRKLVGRLLTASAFEAIGETFESAPMRGLWAFWAGMSIPAQSEGTGLYLTGFGAVHRGGVHRPVRGMGGLMSAFCARLRRDGGEFRMGVAVERILVRDNRAVGVRLVDGSELWARRGVLSTCAPQVTLGHLLESADLGHRTRNAVMSMPANSANVAAFKIDIAVAGPLSFPLAQSMRKRRDAADVRRTTFMTGTLEEHMQHWEAMTQGLNVSRPPVYMSILSAVDPSIAPHGQDVLYLHSNSPLRPQEGWDLAKATFSRSIRASATRFIAGLDAELGAIESSPLDFEERFGLPRGCYFHVDMFPTRMGSNRPAAGLGNYSTSVDGLFLGGAGSHPGGGVNGWPGRLAAERALQQ